MLHVDLEKKQTSASIHQWMALRIALLEPVQRMRRLFTSLMGVVYLCAFGSLWLQLDGLWGSEGVLPAAEFLARVTTALGDEAPFAVPSLLWLGASDAQLHALMASGTFFSLLVAIGVLPRLGLLILSRDVRRRLAAVVASKKRSAVGLFQSQQRLDQGALDLGAFHASEG